MFPRAPDMRLPDTQNQTDGEIYWIIENGIRLTGMPAWGPGGDNDADTWKLVHFIRHLNELTPQQLKDNGRPESEIARGNRGREGRRAIPGRRGRGVVSRSPSPLVLIRIGAI